MSDRALYEDYLFFLARCPGPRRDPALLNGVAGTLAVGVLPGAHTLERLLEALTEMNNPPSDLVARFEALKTRAEPDPGAKP